MPNPAGLARTKALQEVLERLGDEAYAEDLLFLEAWERAPVPGVGTALRVAQIRRANPELAEAIRRELGMQKKGKA